MYVHDLCVCVVVENIIIYEIIIFGMKRNMFKLVLPFSLIYMVDKGSHKY